MIYMKTATGREDPVVKQFEAARTAAYTQDELAQLGDEPEDMELDVVSYFYGYNWFHGFGGRVLGGKQDEIAAAIVRFINAQLRGDEAGLYYGGAQGRAADDE